LLRKRVRRGISERQRPALRLDLIRHHHVPGHDPAHPTESGKRAAGFLRRNNIDAGAETGIERRLIEWALPTYRPFLKKVERLVDTVDLLDRMPEGASDANRYGEMQFVHGIAFERSPLEQR